MPGAVTVSHPLLATNGTAPEWVELVSGGAFRSDDGLTALRMTAPQAVISASLARGPMLVDENYVTQAAVEAGKPAPAVAWNRLDGSPQRQYLGAHGVDARRAPVGGKPFL
jgi:hypothetical protein